VLALRSSKERILAIVLLLGYKVILKGIVDLLSCNVRASLEDNIINYPASYIIKGLYI
jgi:hypothetical protein